MEWKEILKVSIINGLIVFVLLHLVDFVWGLGDDVISVPFSIGSVTLGLLATGAILKKRLKEEWGVLVGLLITFLSTLILVAILGIGTPFA